MSLKSVMGQFGAPEPPTLEERAMELAEQAAISCIINLYYQIVCTMN